MKQIFGCNFGSTSKQGLCYTKSTFRFFLVGFLFLVAERKEGVFFNSSAENEDEDRNTYISFCPLIYGSSFDLN
jgi:hypothetical protein